MGAEVSGQGVSRMEQSDFASSHQKTEFLWGVNGFYRLLFRICGPTQGAITIGASVAVLACSFGYVAWVLYSGSHLAPLWLFPSVYGFLAGHPGLKSKGGDAPLVAVMKSADAGKRDDLGRERRSWRDRSAVRCVLG